MNGKSKHFTDFKRAHKLGMSVTHIEIPTSHPSNGNGHAREMHDSFQLPDKLPFNVWVREWFRNHFGQGWEYVVVNKNVDSVTMPKWIASAILIAILAFGAQSWWARSADHDTMIEIRTELRLAKESDIERARQLKEQGDINKVYIDNMTSQLNVIKGMLSQQQLNSVERTTRKQEN